LSCDINHAIRKFYASANSVFSYAASVSEITKLYLLESYCLPILTYEVMLWRVFHSKKQIGNLNTCWNNAYRKIFRMKKWESVRELQSLCGRYDLKTIFETRRRKFMCQLYDSSNSFIKLGCVTLFICCISGASLFVHSVCLCPICCTLVVHCTVVAAVVCE